MVMKFILLPCLALILGGALPAAARGQFIYSTNADGSSVTITGYTGAGGTVIIPNTINGLSVTSIGNWAFARHPAVTRVTMPDSVTSIGIGAFDATDSHSGLTNVVIGSQVASIGMNAFHFCDRLTSIKIPGSVTNIGMAIFGDGWLPKTTNIGVAFGGCFGLKEIIVDTNNAAYSSRDGVLFNQDKTTLIQCPGGKAGSLIIPNSVTNIGDYAIWNCPKLTSVTIPEGVTRIKKEAFAACGSLTRITIPASVTNIELWAFDSCVSLKAVYFHGNAPGHDEYRGYRGRDIYRAFNGDSEAVVYHLPGTTGWGKTFDGLPTKIWKP
jgi:hypothetical protein